jgi:DNA-binding NtrC family response regulator
VVDDDESVRLTLGANLELDGFDVIDVASAEEALARLEGESFDLVLSDIRMPGIGGVGLLSALKERHPTLPVVLMTAFSNEQTVETALRAGVFTVLHKPFEIGQMVGTLQRAIRRPIVLVVDDIESVAITTAAALQEIGVRAKAVFDGESAVRAIHDEAVDVCVTDLVMPGMDGLEVTIRLREIDPSISVIVCSGVARGEAMMGNAASVGAYRCLRKPLQPEQLAHAIASARREPVK